MPKKIEPLELTDTGEIPTVSVDIDTSYEAMLPDPVPARKHVWHTAWESIPTPTRKYENLLPIASTVIASVVIGAALIATGILIGAGI